MSNKLLWFFLWIERIFVVLYLGLVAQFIVFFVRILLSAQIPETVRIGNGTVFGYGGLGVVIHKDAVIGKNCRIGTGVVLGSRNPDTKAPVIGDSVYLGTGAKVLGGVSVGNGAIVGANAVVISNVPPHSIVVGTPARIVKQNVRTEDYNENYYG